jgi:hypothetical protein
MSNFLLQLTKPPEEVICETYLIEVLEPNTDNWKDYDINKYTSATQAQEKIQDIIKLFTEDYKFRINHIVCAQSILFQLNGTKENIPNVE